MVVYLKKHHLHLFDDNDDDTSLTAIFQENLGRPILECLSLSVLTAFFQEVHPACKNTRCWFVVSDDMTGALHDF